MFFCFVRYVTINFFIVYSLFYLNYGNTSSRNKMKIQHSVQRLNNLINNSNFVTAV